MDLLSLNDDVLLAIFGHLCGEDALSVSLTSKQLYWLAGPRIASDIACTSPEALRRLHAYLLSSSIRGTPRARFVEKFVIRIHTFHSEPDHNQYYANFSQVSLLGDILLQASNIRELYFDRLHPCLERDPRIAHAIRSLTSLEKLDLFVVADASLSIFDLLTASTSSPTSTYATILQTTQSKIRRSRCNRSSPSFHLSATFTPSRYAISNRQRVFLERRDFQCPRSHRSGS
ncbi:hypothetical protein L226DRAFT_152896 [Lentinus tigrinus ALCF2SS1-7]|uniref:uncharacterized protein n=1 Tax=Lentinus tigrinus ALCF2SS1-7 TaxID=1328758 RepID=UPI0011662C56|nr:hypothetical protein L226DRAFT_152896 [Lentinus tigrinus ALCF2SS1-7]